MTHTLVTFHAHPDDEAIATGGTMAKAAAKLAAILEQERADVFTCYDDHGGYGHPDHIQVHRVGHEAARIAGTPKVYESTINRDHLRRLMEAAPDDLRPEGFDDEFLNEFGSPESLITATVEVAEFVEAKRRAMRAHASQIDESSFFLAMPDEIFAVTFGAEWYIGADGGSAQVEDDLFAGLA